jgi:hypothetical protein
VRGSLIRTVGMAIGAAVAILGLAAAARADEKVVAQVPFEFTAGGVRLPAGSYTIAETENPGILLVQDTAHRHSAFVLTIAAETNAPGTPELVFERGGDGYVLVRVDEGGFESRDLLPSQPAKGHERARLTVAMNAVRR